jgi:diamine N-acetyltransferase
MMGPPRYPEQPIPTWDEFCADYLPHFFDGSAPTRGRCFLILSQGEATGQINYNDLLEAGGVRRVELDLWMRSRAWCGQGLGPDALDTLCSYLAQELEVAEFMVQPSARNPAAIRAYEKAGFQRVDGTPAELEQHWGPADYPDSVYLVRRVTPRSCETTRKAEPDANACKNWPA